MGGEGEEGALGVWSFVARSQLFLVENQHNTDKTGKLPFSSFIIIILIFLPDGEASVIVLIMLIFFLIMLIFLPDYVDFFLMEGSDQK